MCKISLWYFSKMLDTEIPGLPTNPNYTYMPRVYLFTHTCNHPVVYYTYIVSVYKDLVASGDIIYRYQRHLLFWDRAADINVQRRMVLFYV